MLEFLKDKDKIFITGCSLCATSCMTGGEKQIAEMKEKLEKVGKTVTGSVVLIHPVINFKFVQPLKSKSSSG